MLLSQPKRFNTSIPAVKVTEETAEELKQLSSKTGISVSELVRRALDLFLSEAANEISAPDNPLREESA